jgi:hypothetical protein
MGGAAEGAAAGAALGALADDSNADPHDGQNPAPSPTVDPHLGQNAMI